MSPGPIPVVVTRSAVPHSDQAGRDARAAEPSRWPSPRGHLKTTGEYAISRIRRCLLGSSGGPGGPFLPDPGTVTQSDRNRWRAVPSSTHPPRVAAFARPLGSCSRTTPGRSWRRAPGAPCRAGMTAAPCGRSALGQPRSAARSRARPSGAHALYLWSPGPWLRATGDGEHHRLVRAGRRERRCRRPKLIRLGGPKRTTKTLGDQRVRSTEANCN
jgi:hypothetical protein